MLRTLLTLSLSVFAANAHAEVTKPLLQAAVAGSHRQDSMKSRDQYRHPLQTLTFFEVPVDATVVEIWPSGGYWTEILAPYLKAKGHYVAAVGGGAEGLKKFTEKFGAKPEVFGKIATMSLDMDTPASLVTDGTADFVLTFRNVHNWMKAGKADAMFQTFFKALKPGGILGLEEHRAALSQKQDPKAPTGYVREDYVIALAKKAGFEIVAKADINANAKDTKDYKGGVWTLPPTLKLGDLDREKYLAIGESDRMTLMFRKPLK